MLVVPAAVGRSAAYDEMELERSIESLRIVADEFVKHSVRAAIEPIRSAETTIVHTVAEAKSYIRPSIILVSAILTAIFTICSRKRSTSEKPFCKQGINS